MIELKKEQAALIWGTAKSYASTHEIMRVFLGGIVFRSLTTCRYCVGYNYCMRSATFADIDDCIASIG